MADTEVVRGGICQAIENDFFVRQPLMIEEVESGVNLQKRQPDEFEIQFSTKREFDYQRKKENILRVMTLIPCWKVNKKREYNNNEDKNT